MDGNAPNDVLGQMAQAAQRAYEARGMSPAKALRRALSRTADTLWDLALVVHAVSVESLSQDGVVEQLGDDDLLVLLEGPEGAIALAVIDRQILTGLVEVQTILQVTQMPLEERELTATDAAMAAPMIDGTLSRFADNLDEHPLRQKLDGFSFGAMIVDQRAVSLLLDAPNYRSFRADVDLALGRRRGTIQLIFPEYPAQSAGKGAPDGPGPHAEQLSLVHARLDAVLVRVKLPLNEAQTLKPGDLLDLPATSIDNLELVAKDDHLVAKGRLGQLDGHRAIKLNWPHVKRAIAEDTAFEAALPQAETPTIPQTDMPMDEPPQIPDFEPPDVAIEEQAFDFEAEAEAFDDIPDFEPTTPEDIGEEFAMSPMEFDIEESG